MLVEDNDGDALLIEEAFKLIPNKDLVIERSRNGEEAIDRLSDRDTVPPDLMLLDINMPRMDGFEVLDTVRSQMGNRTLPIIMLSSSNHQADIDKALSLQANAYVIKAAGFDSLVEQVEHIDHFWLKTAKLS